MSEPWVKTAITPPTRCGECGRVYPENSGWLDGKVEVFKRDEEILCVACAVRKGVAPRASRR